MFDASLRAPAGPAAKSQELRLPGTDRTPSAPLRVRKEINVTDRAEILSILQGAKSEHIEYM
jgi:hypothetical protein